MPSKHGMLSQSPQLSSGLDYLPARKETFQTSSLDLYPSRIESNASSSNMELFVAMTEIGTSPPVKSPPTESNRSLDLASSPKRNCDTGDGGMKNGTSPRITVWPDEPSADTKLCVGSRSEPTKISSHECSLPYLILLALSQWSGHYHQKPLVLWSHSEDSENS